MAATEENPTQSPFSRPGFIAAAVLIAVLVVVGIVLAIVGARGDDEPETEPTPTPPATSAPTAEETPAETETEPEPEPAGQESICGLGGEQLEGNLTEAPEAEWAFQGTTAYPTSEEYGPGETSEEGVRYCFQRSPEGAVFAAANAAVQGDDAETAPAWLEYFVSSNAPGREELVPDEAAPPASSDSEVRVVVNGFRLLHYDGDTARVDVGLRAAGEGSTTYASFVYNLVWEDGDWKLLPIDASNPLQTAQLPDLAGYIPWGE